MRVHQISAQTAKPIDTPVNIVLVPICCTCVAVPGNEETFVDDDLHISISGMPVGDTVVLSLVNTGNLIKITFRGTAICHTEGSIKDALEQLRQVSIEIWTGDVVGNDLGELMR